MKQKKKLEICFRAAGLMIACCLLSAQTSEAQTEFYLTDESRSQIADALNSVRQTQEFELEGEADFVVPTGRFVPFLGPEIVVVTTIENGEQVDKFWRELDPNQWRQMLSDQFIQTLVFNEESNGKFNFFASATVGGGRYRLLYHNFRSKYYPCSRTDPNAGALLVGVGLRIEVDATFRRGSFTLGLPQLALSADRNRVSGVIQADIVGLANSNTLSQVVGAASGGLTYEKLVEASKAYAVANQAVENFVSLSNPRVFGYRDLRAEGSCLAAMRLDGAA